MKSTKKAISVILAVLMLISGFSATFVTANAAATTDSLSRKFGTNPNGQVGVKKTISVDGSISDWDNSMLIAQGVANDDPRVYRENSMYEIPVDGYSLYACWDDSNLYFMWEYTNVQDVVGPNDTFPLSQGNLWINNMPIFIALDTNSSISGDGTFKTGQTIWDSGITIDDNIDTYVACSTNGANGPFIYQAGSDGKFDYDTVVSRADTGITMKWGNGILEDSVIGINGGYGTNHNRVPGDVTSADSDWVDFNTLGHDSDKLDMHYEMSVPLSKIGLTASDISSKGIGAMVISTFGTSSMDDLPADMSMYDNADKAATKSQEFNSMEKEDADHITAPFARIGKLGSNPPTTTQPTTVAPTTQVATTAPATTVQPTTVKPTTVQPTTVPTPQPSTDKLKVNATSNLFPAASQTYNTSDNTVTVKYKLNSSMKLINGQWTLNYDNTKLAYSSSNTIQSVMPATYNNGLVNGSLTNKVKGNFTSLNLYDFSNGNDFVSVTFDIVGTGETTVNLGVEYLGLAYIDSDNQAIDQYLVDNSVVNDVTKYAGFENEQYTVNTAFGNEPATTAVPTAVQPTTVQPTTAVATTAPATQPSTDKLKVNATSNFFPAATQTYNKEDNTITVSYKLTSNMKLINGQWTLNYDNTKLAYSSKNTPASVMPVTYGSGIVNGSIANKVKGNFTSLGLFDFSTEKDFATVTFDVIGSGETNVDLQVEYLGLSYGEDTDAYLVDNSIVNDVTSITGYENTKYSTKTVLSTPQVVTTVQPTTVQPTTVQPTTVQPTTQPVTTPSGSLKVNAKSNILSPVSQTYSSSDKTVTVSYMLTSTMKFINGQWTLNYDNTKLAYSSKNTPASVMPVTYGSGIVNGNLTNKVKGNFTSLGLFDFTTEKEFVTVTFDVIGTGETDLNLNVEYLGVSYLDADGNTNDAYIVDNSVLKDVTSIAGFENEKLTGRIVLNKGTEEILYGDVNNDKIINITDTTLVQKHLASLSTLDADSLLRADADQNGRVDVNDVTAIQKLAVHL